MIQEAGLRELASRLQRVPFPQPSLQLFLSFLYPLLLLRIENDLQMYLGLILLAASLFLLSTCLVLLVKILNSLMENQGGKVAVRPGRLFTYAVCWLDLTPQKG